MKKQQQKSINWSARHFKWACGQPDSVAHGGGRVVSASGSKTSVSGSTPASAIIYDAYTSIKKKKKKKKKKEICFMKL